MAILLNTILAKVLTFLRICIHFSILKWLQLVAYHFRLVLIPIATIVLFYAAALLFSPKIGRA